MQRLEVSGAVRDIYIYIYIYVSRLRVNTMTFKLQLNSRIPMLRTVY
jgi:hypothetical protein